MAYVFVTILNVLFGAIGYMFFGNKVQDIILNNLGDGWYINAAKIALVFDLFFTFVVVILPSRDILEASILGTLQTKGFIPHYKRMIVRSVLISCILGVALAIPQVSDLANLSAGMASSFNTFILAPMLYLKFAYEDIRSGQRILDLGLGIKIVLHMIMTIFGVAAAVLTTYEATAQTIKDVS
jgi:amino acid permease